MTPPLVRPVSAEAPDSAVIAEAAARLRAGGLVAFPTETVYGLGANAFDPEAVARIYAAKGRPATNPLICHVADEFSARQWLAAVWPPAAATLAAAFWPGPLTLVVPARLHVPTIVTAGTPTVAIRVPAHPVALALLRAVGRPIAAPSANRSEAVSPTLAEHVVRSLGAAAEYVLDGGAATVGLESTVVDLTGAVPELLRPGQVTLARLRAVLGDVRVPQATDDGSAAARSPGRQARHYAPRAPLRLVSCAEVAARAADDRMAIVIGRRADLAAAGLATTTPWWETGAVPADRRLALADDAEGFARHLYAALHAADGAGASAVLMIRPPDEPAWAAVGDRLRRAASD